MLMSSVVVVLLLLLLWLLLFWLFCCCFCCCYCCCCRRRRRRRCCCCCCGYFCCCFVAVEAIQTLLSNYFGESPETRSNLERGKPRLFFPSIQLSDNKDPSAQILIRTVRSSVSLSYRYIKIKESH